MTAHQRRAAAQSQVQMGDNEDPDAFQATMLAIEELDS
jgi:hypothetical protein